MPPHSGNSRTQNTIYKLEELRWPEIDALDRDRTMFILPIGMLEEHGPHLPIGSDTFGVAYEADRVAMQVGQAQPRWNVVMMPAIGYGHIGANVIGGQLVHPGTYAIRQSTIRALVADIGAQVALNRFKWIFVLTGHGGPTHGIAVNEACDFVSQSVGATMLHVSGLFRADLAMQAKGAAIAAKHFSPAQIASFGLDVHAGTSETSAILFLRPGLVANSYKKLPALSGQTRNCRPSPDPRMAGLSVIAGTGDCGLRPRRRGVVGGRTERSDFARRRRREPPEGATPAGGTRSRAGRRVRQGAR